MNEYKIVGKFKCSEEIIICVKMESAVCIMKYTEFQKIIKSKKR